MSLSARLHIDGHKKQDKGIRVIECDFEFKQSTDPRGQVTGRVQGGKINVVLDTENDGELLHWMFNNVFKNGKIVYIGPMEGKPIKNIEFENAQLIGYHEMFKETDAVRVQLTISSQKITIAGEAMENQWSGLERV